MTVYRIGAVLTAGPNTSGTQIIKSPPIGDTFLIEASENQLIRHGWRVLKDAKGQQSGFYIQASIDTVYKATEVSSPVLNETFAAKFNQIDWTDPKQKAVKARQAYPEWEELVLLLNDNDGIHRLTDAQRTALKLAIDLLP